MKRFRTLAILGLLSLMLATVAVAGNNNSFQNNAGNNAGGGDCGIEGIISAMPYQEVDDTELAGLLHMREEEKLARDVYLALDDVWGLRAFRNIARAEQTHMDALLVLFNKYGLTDPADGNDEGEFVDQGLQDLFNSLVAQGSVSLNDALVVGATIEDLDISDLIEDLTHTDNEDIATVYQNLYKGSRNHLRTFISLLTANGDTYAPQFITQDEFDAIIDSPAERGMVDANGDLMETTGTCGNPRGPRRHTQNRNQRR
jgi:hypothetical protein